jgi:hypothetical protein
MFLHRQLLLESTNLNITTCKQTIQTHVILSSSMAAQLDEIDRSDESVKQNRYYAFDCVDQLLTFSRRFRSALQDPQNVNSRLCAEA